MPDPQTGGTGQLIPIVIFSDNGKKRETVQVQKIVKSDAEWQRELTPEEFAVARKKGTERALPADIGTITKPVCTVARAAARIVPFRRQVRFRHRMAELYGARGR